MKFIRFWFPVILYSGIIFCVSSIPDIATPLPKVQFDKFLHILEYMPFGFLMARGLEGTKPSISLKNLWILVVLASFAYGISDEYHQSYVPGRKFDNIDIVVDTIGGVIGGCIYLWHKRRIK